MCFNVFNLVHNNFVVFFRLSLYIKTVHTVYINKMSAAVSTSRATSRTSRDKSKIAPQQTQTKTDGPKVKVINLLTTEFFLSKITSNGYMFTTITHVFSLKFV